MHLPGKNKFSQLFILGIIFTFGVLGDGQFSQFRFVVPVKGFYSSIHHLSSDINLKDRYIIDYVPTLIAPSEKAWQAEYHPFQSPMSFILGKEEEFLLKLNFTQQF
jgi:hypothetical protein